MRCSPSWCSLAVSGGFLVSGADRAAEIYRATHLSALRMKENGIVVCNCVQPCALTRCALPWILTALAQSFLPGFARPSAVICGSDPPDGRTPVWAFCLQVFMLPSCPNRGHELKLGQFLIWWKISTGAPETRGKRSALCECVTPGDGVSRLGGCRGRLATDILSRAGRSCSSWGGDRWRPTCALVLVAVNAWSEISP